MLFGLHARAEDPPAGELVFLSVPPRPRERRPPESAFHAEVLMNASKALARELADEELPVELRTQIATQVGELIATAWTLKLPRIEAEVPDGLRRLVSVAAHGSLEHRKIAEVGFRRVVEVIAAHARRNAYGVHRGFDPNANAAAWLARLDHPIAIAALFSVSREAATEEARAHAAIKLGELAARKSTERFTELCARILLE